MTDVIFICAFGCTFTVSVGWGERAGSQGMTVFSLVNTTAKRSPKCFYEVILPPALFQSSGLLPSLPTLVFLTLAFPVSVSCFHIVVLICFSLLNI